MEIAGGLGGAAAERMQRETDIKSVIIPRCRLTARSEARAVGRPFCYKRSVLPKGAQEAFLGDARVLFNFLLDPLTAALSGVTSHSTSWSWARAKRFSSAAVMASRTQAEQLPAADRCAAPRPRRAWAVAAAAGKEV